LIICSTKPFIKSIILSVLKVDSSTCENKLFLQDINPTTFRNLPLAAGNNKGLFLSCHAYGPFGVSPK